MIDEDWVGRVDKSCEPKQSVQVQTIKLTERRFWFVVSEISQFACSNDFLGEILEWNVAANVCIHLLFLLSKGKLGVCF